LLLVLGFISGRLGEGKYPLDINYNRNPTSCADEE
jgi:hypothetical protein